MSNKNFMAYGDAEAILTDYANRIKLSPTEFVGTTAEWNALSATDKAKYTLVNLTDDGEGTDEDYRLIATAAANKTYKEQMADLYNAVVGLNKRDLLRSALYLSDTEIYAIQNKLDTTNRFSYGNIITDSSGITIHGVRFYNNGDHKIYYCKINATNSAVTMSNMESETNTGEMKLIVLD